MDPFTLILALLAGAAGLLVIEMSSDDDPDEGDDDTPVTEDPLVEDNEPTSM